MQRSTILTLTLVAFGALLPAACTQNFSIFDPSGGTGGSSGPTSTASNTSSTGAGGCMSDMDCNDSNPCTIDTCKTSTGKCSNVNVPDGPIAGSMPTTTCLTPGCVMGTQMMVPDDMNVPPNTACTTFTCSMGAVVPDNLPVTTSCGMAPEHCDGMGSCVGCMMDGDCPMVGDCQKQHCDMAMMKCTPTDDQAGSMCSSTGGKVCDGNGTCVACVKDGDCPGGPPAICASNSCVSSCGDGMKDGTETDKDCGGACPPCADGKMCKDGGDCTDQVCTGNTCQAPTCTDGVQNGTETDKDCGGATCDGLGKTCGTGRKCQVAADCTSGDCTSNQCVDQCADGVKDGSETDKDCGGGTCPKCVDGKMCSVATDCQSGDCYVTGGGAGQKTCHGDLCSDGMKDGTETGVDCGGSCPATCADGMGCQNNGDCTDGYCKANVCTAPTCTDTVQDGNETDVDCGGAGFMGNAACPACADTKMCKVNGDCVNDTCLNKVCYPVTCADNMKNGSETDVDCGGGTCPKCGNMKACLVNSDCFSNNCNGASMKCM